VAPVKGRALEPDVVDVVDVAAATFGPTAVVVVDATVVLVVVVVLVVDVLVVEVLVVLVLEVVVVVDPEWQSSRVSRIPPFECQGRPCAASAWTTPQNSGRRTVSVPESPVAQPTRTWSTGSLTMSLQLQLVFVEVQAGTGTVNTA
jgi:hypothetical protein